MLSPMAMLSIMTLVAVGVVMAYAGLKYRTGMLDKIMYRIVLVLGIATIVFALARLSQALYW